MTAVSQSRPWGACFLGTMAVTVPGTTGLLALNEQYAFIDGFWLFHGAAAIWRSPAWALVPLLYRIFSRLPIEKGRQAVFWDWSRNARFAVYEDFVVLREWSMANPFVVQTYVVPFKDIVSIDRPKLLLPILGGVQVTWEVRMDYGTRWFRWPVEAPAELVDHLKEGIARSRDRASENLGSLNPVRRTSST